MISLKHIDEIEMKHKWGGGGEGKIKMKEQYSYSILRVENRSSKNNEKV